MTKINPMSTQNSGALVPGRSSRKYQDGARVAMDGRVMTVVSGADGSPPTYDLEGDDEELLLGVEETRLTAAS